LCRCGHPSAAWPNMWVRMSRLPLHSKKAPAGAVRAG
jgi:hypothetical protein